WIESKPVVQTFSEGIVCRGNAYRVVFNANLNSADAVDLETSDHQRIVSRPLGLTLFDPRSGKRVWLAQLKDCEAEVNADNQIVYANAFDGSNGFKGAIVYTYGVGRFSQDFVLTERPAVSPADFGMSGDARLEMISEVLQKPLLSSTQRVLLHETNATLLTSMA